MCRLGDHVDQPTDVTNELDHADLTAWTQQKMRVSFTFKNEFPYDVSVYWHDELAVRIYRIMTILANA